MPTTPASNSHSAASSEAVTPAVGNRSRPRWVREPILHFALLGALLFAVDQVFAGKEVDAHTIVVGPEVDSEAIEAFEESRGRKPNHRELQALHNVWLDNEVLYREGIAMQVDKGDDAIRERVIFKALSVIDANVRLPPVDDQQLRTWFVAHRVKYDEPARFDFEEAVLSGNSSEATVRAFVESLSRGASADLSAGLRIFKGRPHSNLVQSYGSAFAAALPNLPLGVWCAIETRDGWRAMRLRAAMPDKPAVYESLRGVVLQDWKDAQASEQRSAAVRSLARKYQVTFESRP